MPLLSLIIPCFNEEKNIKKLFSNISILQKKINNEVIIVNNGSTDKTAKEIIKYKKKLKKFKLVNIKKNIGFGYGIKMGIKKASGKFISYTHADLQTDIQDIFRGYKKIKNINNKKFLVKGLRKSKRSFMDIFFSKSMSFLNLLILRKYLEDIHAQPNLFNIYLIKKCSYLPNGMGFDLALMYSAVKNNFDIIRFNVYFKKRKFGTASNDTLMKKIMYSILSIISSIKILYEN